MMRTGLPPSVLPDISPSRGEIDSWLAPQQTVTLGASGCSQLISPPVGEMPGRAEGGGGTRWLTGGHSHAH
jgi:hypothetical protein